MAVPADAPPPDLSTSDIALDTVDLDAADAKVAPDVSIDAVQSDAADGSDDAADGSDDAADGSDAPPDVPGGCARDADCATSSAGPVCNLVTGRCVACVTSNDTCPVTQHCDEATNTCVAGCRADEGCAMATGDGGAAPRRCDTRLNACVECATDAHCGAGSVCRGNVCVTGCAATGCTAPQTCCTGGCVDTSTNTANCGACGTTCTVANATPACRAGRCAIGACDEGYADCDGAPENGCEVDTRSSASHCAGCGRECPPVAGATPACAAGRCGFACDRLRGDCDGMAANGCEADLRADVARCGACGTRCAAPTNGTAACVDGACRVGMCNTGFGNCDRNDANGCETVLNTSESHCGACGNACPAGQVCNTGRCEIACPRGQTNCGGECVVLNYDPENCGRCGTRCTAGQLCSSGACVGACSTGQTVCAGGCTNTQSDPENCGRCGNACPMGNSCMMGTCRVACITGQTLCGAVCADLTTSLIHCGACGNACASGEQCRMGRCVLTCRPPQVVCGAECAELQRDPNHCGACGRVCPTGCFFGACARIDTLEAGFSNNCARYTSGRVFCWGLNSSSTNFTNGMLSSTGGSYGHRPTPVQLVNGMGVPLEGVEQVVMGNNRACARITDGRVLCWGFGVAMGEVFGLPAVRQLAAREGTFCGLTATGLVYCWDGLARAPSAPALTPVAGLPTTILQLAVGSTYGCALLTDGTVRCWGTGTSGQLGNGASLTSAAPVQVRNLADATEITAGQNFTCARRMSGDVVCWGLNSDGQLGDGTITTRNAPVIVAGLTGAQKLRAGLRHICAILTDGSIRCWGDNQWSQLGDGTTTDRTSPVPVAGLMERQRLIAAYDHHTCAVGIDNRAHCWGYNPFGEAGGGTESVNAPRPVQLGAGDLTGAVDVQSGNVQNPTLMATTAWHCALHSDGRVLCWGTRVHGNESGQLGDGTTVQRATPAPVLGLTDATQLAVGWTHACALRRGGTVVCWGANGFGQIGDGTTTNRPTPTPVAGLSDVVELRSGDYHVCARVRSGAVQCWGYNFYGELGDGTMINRSRPGAVMGISTAQQLAVGTNHTCARLANSEVHCWGRNTEGQLGDGFRTNRSIPYPVQASTATPAAPVSQTGITDIMCETLRCWGRTTAGTVLGWGWLFPARATVVPAFATVTQNSRAWAFNDPQDPECEVRTDMMTWCRGRNEFGQVGVGAPSLNETAHRSISSAFTTVRMARGYGAPCAVERGTGRVLCWGWTGNGGLLATGATGLSTRPFEVIMP